MAVHKSAPIYSIYWHKRGEATLHPFGRQTYAGIREARAAARDLYALYPGSTVKFVTTIKSNPQPRNKRTGRFMKRRR